MQKLLLLIISVEEKTDFLWKEDKELFDEFINRHTGDTSIRYILKNHISFLTNYKILIDSN